MLRHGLRSRHYLARYGTLAPMAGEWSSHTVVAQGRAGYNLFDIGMAAHAILNVLQMVHARILSQGTSSGW